VEKLERRVVGTVKVVEEKDLVVHDDKVDVLVAIVDDK
jgi:hypothetical protein